jgi:Ankyrin repeats (many copies)
MNTTENNHAQDPVIDAYRQANKLVGGQPGVHLRAAVLAHARVVAQSSTSTGIAATSPIGSVTRNTPAANESRPLWRLAAGVVVGLVGVWIFQLTRPAPNVESTVALVREAPAAAPVSAPVSAPAAAPAAAPIAAAAPAANLSTAEATAVAAAPAKPAAAVPAANSRTPFPVDTTASASARSASRTAGIVEKQTEPAMPEQSLALAKKLQPTQSAAADVAVAVIAPRPQAAAAVASVSAADSAFASAMPRTATVDTAAASEKLIASAETQKSSASTRRESAAVATVAAAAPAAPAAAAPAPPPAAPAPAAVRPVPAAAAAVAVTRERSTVSETAVASGAAGLSSAKINAVDQALFTAIYSGDLTALRAALARGANVNAKDERGRTALQIAKDRPDTEAARLLEAAGAR